LELESALKPISEQLLRELDELAAIESEKRELDVTDDRTLTLATRARELAQRVLATSVVEEQVVRTANDAAGEPSAGTSPRSLPIRSRNRPLPVILDEWREAERALELAVTPDDAGARRARAQALRDEYQRAFEAVERQEGTRPG
jgi:hypothetical protein